MFLIPSTRILQHAHELTRISIPFPTKIMCTDEPWLVNWDCRTETVTPDQFVKNIRSNLIDWLTEKMLCSILSSHFKRCVQVLSLLVFGSQSFYSSFSSS